MDGLVYFGLIIDEYARKFSKKKNYAFGNLVFK